MHTIFTPLAPTPAGHYSQAIVHERLVYVAGQLPIVPGQTHVVGSIEDQTRQVLHNVSMVLEAAGSSLNHLLKVTIYVSDMALWGRVNAIYSEVLGDHKPARAVVPVNPLHHGFQIEIDAIAALLS
ncbi:MAG: RidA family protein [Bacteroidetes Order II. Incertae sedis bacterium]|nr:RidA family protein [Bacteroidetes Order II. bacterium]